MAVNKNIKTPPKPVAGKGSLSEAKTNEDFNKKSLIKMTLSFRSKR